MFTPSRMLLNYLNAQPRDMYDVVGALMGYINADLQFKTKDFEQAIQYVLAHGVREGELFAPFNAELDFEEDQTKWNEEYYCFAQVYLKDNFCEKRINHLKEVARKLYPMAAQAPIPAPTKNAPLSASSGGTQSARKKRNAINNHKEERTQMSTRTRRVITLIIVVLVVLVVMLIASRM